MDLRCLVFSSDSGSAALICQVLAELGAEAEHCSEAMAAIARIGSESFQIVIVDWDQPAEAELVLKASRGRKAGERPLALAVVSQDSKVPKALQAGANSILRKPVLVNQVKDTLQTARSLLKARQDSSMAMAASAAAAPPVFAVEPPSDAHLRAGEFLQSTGQTPATQIDTESEMQKSIEQSAASDIDPLKNLEPMAAAMAPEAPPPAPAPDRGETRGLQWYLKNRGVASPYVLSHAEAQVPAPAPAPEKPEVIGFDQTPTQIVSKAASPPPPPAISASSPEEQAAHEEKAEAKLFAYINTGSSESSPEESRRSFWPGKGVIIFAVILAAAGIAAAPQAPWHQQMRGLWAHGRQAIHGWLNPQPVAPPQAPAAHEDFGRAGDEYKLPVAEAIPDATTDPSQIRVTPVIDPTAKKPNAGNADPNGAPADVTPANPGDPAQPAADPSAVGQSPANSGQGNTAAGSSTQQAAPSVTPTGGAPSTETVIPPTPSPKPAPIVVAEVHRADPFAGSTAGTPTPVHPAPPRNPQPRPVSASPNPQIPSSLKSQMASMTPEASGNKAPETALPSIEPVEVPEATERGMLAVQPAIAYPASAKGQQGTVVLQVLIGRDGTVQDAKFLQGSLAFARTAIDGVKQWTFKPYSMNGRPVSVQTKLTLSFRPGQ